MATNMVMPFIALQMSNKGLSDGDISLILGVMPFTLVPIMPLIGKFSLSKEMLFLIFLNINSLGMLGDKFGYKYIISANCLLLGATMTAFHYVPSFYQGNLKYPSFNLTEDQELFSIQWPICNGTETCEDSRPIIDDETFMEELTNYISDVLNITDLETPQHFEYNQTIEMENGTFCLLTNSADLGSSNMTSYIFEDILDTCNETTGSHTITFWIMMLLMFIFKANLVGGFAMFEGVSQLQAAKHHSKLNYIIFYTMVSTLLAPFLSSWTITTNEDGTNDYSIMYFVSDGILFLASLLCLFLIDFETVQKDEQPIQEPLMKALPKLFSVPFLVLIFGVFITGLQWGVHDGFLFLYLREDLNADFDLLSYMIVISLVSQVCTLPFAAKIIKYMGTANAIFFNIVIESTRLLIYSWVEQSPPYYALGLHALDFTLWSFSWIGTLTYGYLITPPTIAATMSTVLALTEFTISKSLGTFIGGQLRNLLTRQELFRWTAFVTTGLGLVFYLLYYLLARKSEKLIIEQLNLKYPQRLKKIKDVNNRFPEEDIVISKF